MPILKCRQCDAPMNETRKGRPEKLPDNIKWLVCRQCNNGVEFIVGTNDAPETSAQVPLPPAKAVDVMEFEEPITTIQYVRISKITGEDGSTIMKKEIFSDKERKTLINTVKL